MSKKMLGAGVCVLLFSAAYTLGGITPKIFMNDEACAELREDGTVWCWGMNQHGVLGIGAGDYAVYALPQQVPLAKRAVDLALGHYAFCLVATDDGEVWGWGSNHSGQLGESPAAMGGTNLPVRIGSLSGICAVAAGGDTAFAMATSGAWYAWGYNGEGQMGAGLTNLGTHVPTPMVFPLGVVRVKGSADFAAAIVSNAGTATVYTWGYNGSGRLGLGHESATNRPTPALGSPPAAEIALGDSQLLVRDIDGRLWACGDNALNQLGSPALGAKTNRLTLVPGLTNLALIGAGQYNGLAVDRTGRLLGWGYNSEGQLGSSNFGGLVQAPQLIPAPTASVFIALSAAQDSFAGLLADGTVWTCGSPGQGILGCGFDGSMRLPRRSGWSGAPPLQFVFNGMGGAAVQFTDTLLVWGADPYGWRGVGNEPYSASPRAAGGGVSKVALGGEFMLALRGGAVYGSGLNSSRQLGLPLSVSRTNLPTQVPGLPLGLVDVKAGWSFALALAGDGSVWSWGDGYSGQLGTGLVVSNALPARVGTPGADLDGVAAIAAGAGHAVALRTNGTVWAWGANYFGQVGNGRYGDTNRPVQAGAGDLTNASAVYACGNNSAALQDGRLWIWGDNDSGQLGRGYAHTKTNRPTLVPGLSNIVQAALGDQHVLALDSNQALWAWGSDKNGQTGTGATNSIVATPVRVAALANVALIGAGGGVSAARADGGVYVWGGDFYGETGLGLKKWTPQSVTACLAIGPAGTNDPLRMSWNSAEGVAYRIERVDDLGTGAGVVVAVVTAGAPFEVTYTPAGGALAPAGACFRVHREP